MTCGLSIGMQFDGRPGSSAAWLAMRGLACQRWIVEQNRIRAYNESGTETD